MNDFEKYWKLEMEKLDRQIHESRERVLDAFNPIRVWCRWFQRMRGKR